MRAARGSSLRITRALRRRISNSAPALARFVGTYGPYLMARLQWRCALCLGDRVTSNWSTPTSAYPGVSSGSGGVAWARYAVRWRATIFSAACGWTVASPLEIGLAPAWSRWSGVSPVSSTACSSG